MTELGETTGSITQDLACANCGYNLRTQPIAGRCPECGLGVSRSLPPRGFRFRKMATVFRVRRGLALVAVGIVIQVLAAITLFVVLRWYYKLPSVPWAIRVLPYFYAQYAGLIVSIVGLVLITYPFGWRGDRFLPCLGVAVAVLTMLFVAESIADDLWSPGGSGTFGLSWNAYLAIAAPFWYCLPVAHVLVWVNLSARVRAAEHKGLWAVALLVLSTQIFLLAQGLCRYLSFLAGSEDFPGPSGVVSWGGGLSDDWLGGWERQINGVAWIVTLIGVWSYLRELNRLVAGGESSARTRDLRTISHRPTSHTATQKTRMGTDQYTMLVRTPDPLALNVNSPPPLGSQSSPSLPQSASVAANTMISNCTGWLRASIPASTMQSASTRTYFSYSGSSPGLLSP